MLSFGPGVRSGSRRADGNGEDEADGDDFGGAMNTNEGNQLHSPQRKAGGGLE